LAVVCPSFVVPTLFREEIASGRNCLIVVEKHARPLNQNCEMQEVCVNPCKQEFSEAMKSLPEIPADCGEKPDVEICEVVNATRCHQLPAEEELCERQCTVKLEERCEEVQCVEEERVECDQEDEEDVEDCHEVLLQDCLGDDPEEMGRRTCETKRDVRCDCGRVKLVEKCKVDLVERCVADAPDPFALLASQRCPSGICAFPDMVAAFLDDLPLPNDKVKRDAANEVAEMKKECSGENCRPFNYPHPVVASDNVSEEATAGLVDEKDELHARNVAGEEPQRAAAVEMAGKPVAAGEESSSTPSAEAPPPQPAKAKVRPKLVQVLQPTPVAPRSEDGGGYVANASTTSSLPPPEVMEDRVYDFSRGEEVDPDCLVDCDVTSTEICEDVANPIK